VLLLWFLGSLYGKLRAAEGGDGRLSRVAIGSGVAAVALAGAANAIGSSAALRGDPGVFRLGAQFYGYTGFVLAVFTAAVSIVIWNNGLLPKWLGYAGEAIAVGWFVGAASVSTENDTIGTIGFIVFGVWAIWVAAVSVLLYRGAEA